MRHDPINVSADDDTPSRSAARRPRRPATRRPTPIDIGIPIAASEDQGERLAAEVLDSERTLPIVCLSTRSGEDRPSLDPHHVRKLVGRDVLLRAVRTGPASRFLSSLLPPQLGVFGGAARIWWPGVDEHADPRAHPLVLDRVGRYGARAVEVLKERFDEGPPAPSASPSSRNSRAGERPAARLVALPGGAPKARTEPAPRPADQPTAKADRDQQLLLGALDGAREEIRHLREKLAAARLDAMTPGARASAAAEASTADEERAGAASGPRGARPEQVARLAIPAAVVRERERAHQLEIYAAWLARDHDSGRRARPLGPLALGEGYLEALDRHRHRVAPATMAVVAARIASGKQGEADDLDVRAEYGGRGQQELREEDGAACWSCAVPDAGQLRLRWWTRDDGAVELRDLD